uniref:Pyruvate kinase n=1 Tax=Heliothis virescens TaxID=7102 RepID=A0A2A4J6V0_HELVI
MALPWHIPLEAAVSPKTRGSPPQQSLFKHYCNLDIHKSPCEELQTGLMCDIGTQNREPAIIQRLIASGMTVARLNMRDMEPDARGQLTQSIRQAVYNYSAELEYVYPLALIVDIRGPDIITGDLKGGPKSTVDLIQLNTVRLTTDSAWRECGTSDCLYIGYDHLTDLHPKDIIFIESLASGSIKLVINDVGDDSVDCTIAVGGTIGSKMTVRISQTPKEIEHTVKRGSIESIPCSETSEQSLEHMQEQVAWAIGADIDAVMVPNTQQVQDIRVVRDLLSERGKHILIIACMDSLIGLDNFDDILASADGIFMDRSVLCTDLPVEKIFIAQKMISAKCAGAGKPFICKAVINEQIPTLCVSDIANLVLDCVDVIALELHYDSPLKKFPGSHDSVKMAEQCLAAAAVICRNAEAMTWHPYIYGNTELMESPLDEPTKAISINATELAMRARAVVIICLTNSGRTAKLIAHARPHCPVIAVTRACHTARQLRFWRGVRAMHYFEVAKTVWTAEVEARVHAALDYCKAKRLLRAGDAYVLVTGSRRGVGYCDSVRLLYASARNTITVD